MLKVDPTVTDIADSVRLVDGQSRCGVDDNGTDRNRADRIGAHLGGNAVVGDAVDVVVARGDAGGIPGAGNAGALGGCRTVGCGDTVGTGVVGIVIEGHRDGLLGIGEIVVDVEGRSDSDRYRRLRQAG